MNAPAPLPLPPLAPFVPPGTQPRVSADALGLAASDLTPDLPNYGFPNEEPIAFACDPTPLEDAQLCLVVPEVARLLALEPEALAGQAEWHALLSGAATLAERNAYASVYAGHQFGSFVPRLGDGRALNLGAVRGWVLQLKGAGTTPYARFADGRAVLRSSVRELLCSEAMAGLGVPTTRALSLVVSSTPVFREAPEPAAIVCRVAPSFVRFGHFEYLAARGRPELMMQLVDQLVLNQTAFASLRNVEGADRLAGLFHLTVDRTAALMADWTAVGFMHGVMHTDNFSILGLTLDYGPFAWMEAFDPHQICNHSDHSGRYRFSHQPSIGLWNLERLLAALCTSPLISLQRKEALRDELLERYERSFQGAFRSRMANKLGVSAALPNAQWEAVLNGLYGLLHAERLDYSQFFAALCRCNPLASNAEGWTPLRDQVLNPVGLEAWLAAYQPAAASEAVRLGTPTWQLERSLQNPRFVLRNWVAEEVIRALEDEGNLAPLQAASRFVAEPYRCFADDPLWTRWTGPAPDWASKLSLSCSS
ncbi:MAG: protein adenylyltransferase SelO [Burkholderiaceae bacterium]